ncbi:MAG: lamin tail domain-containing protein [Methanothrix sp.]|nr:lamin tail domain-containing protein [Methanothrix sp.]
MFHTILLPAAASSLSLFAPSEVDISGEGVYEMNFISSDDARSLSAQLQLPLGFSSPGNANIIWHGTKSSCEPNHGGQSLQWDISSALKSNRHIIINEWEQNPEGTDTLMEWIELYNPTSQAVNIGGWKLVDSYYKKSVSFSPGTVIVPDGYQLLTWTNGSLVNSYPSSISLLDSSGQEVDRTPAAKDDKNNNLCWGRYPNGKDMDSDLDWKFQAATAGSSNGGNSADIYAGESLSFEFNLTAGCSAQSQAQLSAEMITSVGKTLAPTLPLNIRRANLSLSVSPDRFDIAKGDEIAWTILLENDGYGTAYGVAANVTLDPGLQLVEIDSLNWSYASLAPGQTEQIILKARAVSAQSSYSSTFQARWGVGPCQEIRQLSKLGARTAIRKQPDQPRRLTVGETVGFEISADLPRGAHDLWINDTIAKGLIYNQSSLSTQGPGMRRELVTENSDGTQQIGWFFGDAGPVETIAITYNCLLANEPENQDGAVLGGTIARMSWQDGPALKADADEAGSLTVVEPELVLEMQVSRPFAAPEEPVSFTLLLYHSDQSHAPAFDLDLQALLPAGLAYEPGSAQVLAGPAAAFDDQELRWHLDALDLEWNAGQKALLRFNATARAAPGELMEGRAEVTWTSRAGASAQERTGAGGVNDYRRGATARVNIASLTISKTADPNPVPVGETLTYILTYEYRGIGAAHNVNITDDLDPGVTFLSAHPAPSQNNTRNMAWTVPSLDPDGPHTVRLQVHVHDDLPDGVLLENRFIISCDELRPKSGSIYTPVQNGTLLSINKTPLQKAVRRGEEVSYIITVCNKGGQPATNVTVRDVFASAVELISVWPEMGEDEAWHFASLAPGQCVQMGLTVRVPRTDVLYQSQQNVTGQGFVRSYRDYSTRRPAGLLTNRVYVSSDQMQLSAIANVKILAEEGTELSLREHGSGDYENQEDLRFLTTNKSIRLERSVNASYHPTTLLLPGSGLQKVSCLWHEEALAKNGITNTSFAESYRYSANLESEGLFDLDENGSLMQITSGFQGLAHLGTLKRPAPGREEDIFSVEDYAGSFQLAESVHDLGQGLMMDRSASGRGYVAKDMKGRGQRSYESGTGAYRSEERSDTFSGFMAKDLDASYHSLSHIVTPRTFLNISQKWSEGMRLHSPSSLIAEEYSSANRLKKKAVAASPRELLSEANFSGTAKLRTAVVTNGTLVVDQDDTLMGDYEVSRRIMISGVAKYDRPHLCLRKDGLRIGDVAVYTITITNDGNATIGPLFLQDIFPSGARFLNSTLRPNQIGQNGSNWTLLHLSIGDTLRIGINLNVEKCQGDIINRAIVVGNCSLGQVAAQNLSVIDRAWLGGLPPQERAGGVIYAAANISCACSGLERANETDYLDAMQMEMQWDSEEDGGCLLSCPALEATDSVKG